MENSLAAVIFFAAGAGEKILGRGDGVTLPRAGSEVASLNGDWHRES